MCGTRSRVTSHHSPLKRSLGESYFYWTVHHLDSWIKIDQLDVTCFIISLFHAQHVSNVNTSILRSLRLIFLSHFMGYIALVRCLLVLRCGSAGQGNTTHEITQHISRTLLRIAVLTFETCWALNNEIIKQVTSNWSILIQLETLVSNYVISEKTCNGWPCKLGWNRRE